MDIGAELLHEEFHHPLGTRHLVFGLHVDVSEKSLQDYSEASICTLCAKLHHPKTIIDHHDDHDHRSRSIMIVIP